MKEESKKEVVEIYRKKYEKLRSKKYRSELLSTFCEIFGYERKYAQKLLKGTRKGSGEGRKSRSGRKRKYKEEDKEILKTIWLKSDQPCGRRLKSTLPIWLKSYSKKIKPISKKDQERISQISASQIDRYIAEYRIKEPIRPEWRQGRSNNAIKAQIPIRAEKWNVEELGWLEVDTVALCGGNMSESFVWILTATDIWSGWTELRPVWNKSAKRIIEHFDQMEESSPFDWQGIDSDNGGEFINYELIKWKRLREYAKKRMQLSRSRAYRKNDQAHVEQKNSTHVREFFGYERHGHQQLIESMQEVSQLWSLYNNLYRATMKQTESYRQGSKLIRKHEKEAKSPAQRILEHPDTNPAIKKAIEKALKENDPWSMREECERGLQHVENMRQALSATNMSELNKDGVAENFGKLNLRYAPIELAKISSLCDTDATS